MATIRKLIATATALAALATAAPALAQNGPPASQFAPRVDRPTCTRDELKALTAAYVEGQRSGSLAALPLASNAHYLENMETVDAAAGLWNTALPVANALSFHDDLRCKTFTEIVVTEGGTPYIIGTRLYAHEGRVIRVDSIVTKTGDWLFNANAFLRYTQAEDWSILHPYQRTSPAEMIRGANAYLDGFADKFTDIPWGVPCARLEGGAYTNRDGRADASCEVGMPPGVLYITNRDYLIDEEMGTINVFCRFGGSTGGADSHTFRYIDGKFRLIHTLTAIPGPQANDEGGMVPGAIDPNA
ncbi:hypothetical protein M3P36_01195 [Altererythrobacter sp. KTW20L]|uniref:hypothetical protein n=1 Tax=Altererythrobacter sp. KTW20L TaxID=2942210 RepID=UPI0020BE81A8|nr:hypothetical protein [Altererythrobacter sp. KTW20L]MCL6249665.1 hypothetical protein [Altererythrobacter sp. KTW20L]